MEIDQKIKIIGMLLGGCFVFSLILFSVSFYQWSIQENSINTIGSNIKSLNNAVNYNLNASTQLKNQVDYNLLLTSQQMDTLRTEDNLNFFRFWLLMQTNRDRNFIESQTDNMDTSCLSSIDNINLNQDIFTMWTTVKIDDNSESRQIRFSKSAVTCYYFDMTIDCEDFCESMTSVIE